MRRLLALAAIALVLPSTAAAGGGPGGPVRGYGPYPQEARAVLGCATDSGRAALYRACLERNLLALVLQTHDPADELPRIDAYVHSSGGWLQANCHVLFHAVGRQFGDRAHVTLGTLLRYLPKTNDPGCSAGFTHGMLISLGPEIRKLGPTGAVADCNRAPTRYQRYSCVHGLGHAYARLMGDQIGPALALCKQLGAQAAPDCAQGVFHDYWISIAGLDAAHAPPEAVTDPRRLCGAQQAEFVLPCWYRVFLERPPRQPVTSAARLTQLCAGLDGIQHEGCVVGGSVVSSDDPFAQMHVCAGLGGVDALACVRGVRIPALALSPLGDRLRLLRGCAAFPSLARRGCYTWLGLGFNVVANGRFAAVGCSRLRYAATRAACADGARAYGGPLATFS